MPSIQTIIRGAHITLRPDTEDVSIHGRIGSVPVAFADGTRRLIRVYGPMPKFDTREERVEFEKEIRKFCEKEEVIEELFGYCGEGPLARRFNPSEALKDTGWMGKSYVVRAIH